jgi:methyl-accepting chemotaxis protein
MLEELDQLAARVRELAQTVHALRADNQNLRRQLATTTDELDAMHHRVDEVARRLDSLMERLPLAQAALPGPWNT